jgi:predicted RNase H-like nuclease
MDVLGGEEVSEGREVEDEAGGRREVLVLPAHVVVHLAVLARILGLKTKNERRKGTVSLSGSRVGGRREGGERRG